MKLEIELTKEQIYGMYEAAHAWALAEHQKRRDNRAHLYEKAFRHLQFVVSLKKTIDIK